ncbi:hypothetical protein [Leptolyngbya sp. BC1307]
MNLPSIRCAIGGKLMGETDREPPPRYYYCAMAAAAIALVPIFSKRRYKT